MKCLDCGDTYVWMPATIGHISAAITADKAGVQALPRTIIHPCFALMEQVGGLGATLITEIKGIPVCWGRLMDGDL